MFNKWLKPYLPRSLFGRAILILIVPIVLIQVIVGVVFVERLFQDVTRQMTRSVSVDLNHLISILSEGGNPSLAANGLEIPTKRISTADVAQHERLRDIHDFSGPYVIETILAEVPEARVVDLGRDRGLAVVQADLGGRWFEFQVSRQRVSASNPHQVLVDMILASILLSALAAVFLRNQISPIRRLARMDRKA